MSRNAKYELDNHLEPQRLEEQSKTFNYSLLREFDLLGVNINSVEKILDAGCGTGLLGRQLLQQHRNPNIQVVGIDNSAFLLQRAKAENTQAGIQDRFKLLHQSLFDLNQIDEYSKIFCRYVLQHVPTDEQRSFVINKLLKSLKPDGEIFLIDSFGIFAHIDTNNKWLKERISYIEKNAPIDFNVGIKLRGFLIDNGIKAHNISMEILPFNFNSLKDRMAEAKNWEQRFINAKPLLISLLGEIEAERFAKEYIEVFLNERSLVLAYKILVKGQKSE